MTYCAVLRCNQNNDCSSLSFFFRWVFPCWSMMCQHSQHIKMLLSTDIVCLLGTSLSLGIAAEQWAWWTKLCCSELMSQNHVMNKANSIYREQGMKDLPCILNSGQLTRQIACTQRKHLCLSEDKIPFRGSLFWPNLRQVKKVFFSV